MEERLFMKINHIREFLLLVSNRNFSKTAEQLYMAQSALSRHISPIKKDAEDTFRTTAGCSVPYIGALQSGQYQCEYTVKPIFIFQFSGPLSLTILEKATKTDLHDLKFLEFRPVRIPEIDTELEICRIGMSGTLAYEIHGYGNVGYTRPVPFACRVRLGMDGKIRSRIHRQRSPGSGDGFSEEKACLSRI